MKGDPILIGKIPAGWPIADACVITSETEARRLVTAIEDCRVSDVIAIVKRQPWFEEIRAGVRTTRHLKPLAYRELSRLPLPTS
jgi:hypothetical protein